MQTHPGNGQPTNQRAAQMGKTRRTRRAGGDGGDGAAGIEVAWLAVNPDGDDRITRKQLLDAVHLIDHIKVTQKCNKTCRSVRHLKDHIRKSKAHEDEYKQPSFIP
ncbi:hypothetical protein PTSG_06484 [Salpingoeca rosetta]|uniref:EF-hand domain-containing protein n=1 Tax=Salpingoeca rosetta (strain ATCC 50818 / BSB-021) TaxID=946362 RepID=F2UFY1_SALR5|nr:uncharacterized protein PTSG_06484 [Salpingoeca rosetta]EGD75409.1 hypothetical protein PTSG_06484 [Salpingoeca rosetta]|eukprot:XP_004991866.1 hypothetical protein PTSG_06484 [Salpingoeca rosetta]